MPDTIQSVSSHGIYHGLPLLRTDDDSMNLNAVVVGASGMSGQSMIDVLAADPKRWKKIYALSRRPPLVASETKNVQHVAVDFLEDPMKTAATLGDAFVRA